MQSWPCSLVQYQLDFLLHEWDIWREWPGWLDYTGRHIYEPHAVQKWFLLCITTSDRYWEMRYHAHVSISSKDSLWQYREGIYTMSLLGTIDHATKNTSFLSSFPCTSAVFCHFLLWILVVACFTLYFIKIYTYLHHSCQLFCPSRQVSTITHFIVFAFVMFTTSIFIRITQKILFHC